MLLLIAKSSRALDLIQASIEGHVLSIKHSAAFTNERSTPARGTKFKLTGSSGSLQYCTQYEVPFTMKVAKYIMFYAAAAPATILNMLLESRICVPREILPLDPPCWRFEDGYGCSWFC